MMVHVLYVFSYGDKTIEILKIPVLSLIEIVNDCCQDQSASEQNDTVSGREEVKYFTAYPSNDNLGDHTTGTLISTLDTTVSPLPDDIILTKHNIIHSAAPQETGENKKIVLPDYPESGRDAKGTFGAINSGFEIKASCNMHLLTG